MATAPELSPQRAERTLLQPTVLLFRHHQSSTKLLPHQSHPSSGKRSTRREESRAWNRRFRSLFRIERNSSKQVGKRKLSRSGAMTDHEESLSNGHTCQPLLWITWRFLQRIRLKAQVDGAPLRPIRSSPRIVQDYSAQARTSKFPCPGAMADLEESFSNGHIRHLLL